jgi:chromosome segregation ATPase
MPTKKRASKAPRKSARRARKSTSTVSGVSAMAAAQLKQLRKTVDQLKSRLQKESKGRSLDARLLQEARNARERVAGQINALREQGTRLSKQLKKALGDADKREMARQQALNKIAELRSELTRRTDELKRKSEELASLARESAGRARDIIMSEAREPAPSGDAGAEPSSHEHGEHDPSDF